MEQQAIPTANYLDILFDNRNKTYGGYELRKNYNKRTATACAIVFSTILLSAAYAVFTNGKSTLAATNDIRHRETTICTITLPPVVLPKHEIKPPPVAPKVNTVKITPPIIVPDKTVLPNDLPPDKTKLENAVAGNTNSDGENAHSGTPSIPGNDKKGNTITQPVAPPTSVPYTAVQEMPEFNGDINKYLSKQLTYPSAARENGIEGQVIVQFIVNEDGAISGAKIMRGISGGCNEEALRVVNSMPKWKPGKQNGKAVKVYYTLPIRFMLS